MGGRQNYYQIVVACLVVLAAATPLAQGQSSLGPILGPISIRGGLNLTTSVCCTPTGACTPGAAGLQNVTGILRCLNPVTGLLTEVGRAISTSNGTIVITVPIIRLVTTNVVGLLSGVAGSAVPCVLTGTLGLVNQAVCPLLNTVDTVLLGVPTVVGTVLSTVNGLLTLILRVVTLNINLGVNA